METQEPRELNSVLKNTNLLLSDQMFFHLCTATAVWREGTTQFKQNHHSSSRFNWSLRFSIIFQIKELYYFLCIIEIVLNVSKHMIRKWDLLNEQEIALQFSQFQWAFSFFPQKENEKERKRGRSSLCCVHLFTDLSLNILLWFWKHKVFAGASQWFLPSPAELGLHSVLSGGKLLGGREERQMIKPSCHAGERQCV